MRTWFIAVLWPEHADNLSFSGAGVDSGVSGAAGAGVGPFFILKLATRFQSMSTKMTSTVGWRICGLRAQCLQPVFVMWAEGPGIRKQCRIEIVGLAGGPRCFFPAFVYRLQQWHSTRHTSCFPGVCGKVSQRCAGGA